MKMFWYGRENIHISYTFCRLKPYWKSPQIQVWNIQHVPYMEAAVVNYGVSFVAGVGSLMLRASNNLLEVFNPQNLLAPQNSPKCDINLTFACFIDGKEKFPESVETTSDVYKVTYRSRLRSIVLSLGM